MIACCTRARGGDCQRTAATRPAELEGHVLLELRRPLQRARRAHLQPSVGAPGQVGAVAGDIGGGAPPSGRVFAAGDARVSGNRRVEGGDDVGVELRAGALA